MAPAYRLTVAQLSKITSEALAANVKPYFAIEFRDALTVQGRIHWVFVPHWAIPEDTERPMATMAKAIEKQSTWVLRAPPGFPSRGMAVWLDWYFVRGDGRARSWFGMPYRDALQALRWDWRGRA